MTDRSRSIFAMGSFWSRQLAIAGLLSLALIFGAHADTPSVEVRVLGEDWYQLSLTSSGIADVGAGQRQLLPTAQALCADKPVRFGKYAFEAQEPIAAPGTKSLLLKQEIHCGAGTTPQPDTATQSDSRWPPSDNDKKMIELLTKQYFAAKDLGNYRDAFGLLAPSMQEITPLERWSALAQQFNETAGTVRSRRIRKVTWYKDPPGATMRGIYAAADYVSAFENIDIHCGYLVWHQQDNGSFRLVREEANYIDKKTQKALEASALAAIKTKFGC